MSKETKYGALSRADEGREKKHLGLKALSIFALCGIVATGALLASSDRSAPMHNFRAMFTVAEEATTPEVRRSTEGQGDGSGSGYEGCMEDTECESGETCSAGVCMVMDDDSGDDSGCAADSECGSGESCDKTTGTCKCDGDYDACGTCKGTEDDPMNCEVRRATEGQGDGSGSGDDGCMYDTDCASGETCSAGMCMVMDDETTTTTTTTTTEMTTTTTESMPTDMRRASEADDETTGAPTTTGAPQTTTGSPSPSPCPDFEPATATCTCSGEGMDDSECESGQTCTAGVCMEMDDPIMRRAGTKKPPCPDFAPATETCICTGFDAAGNETTAECVSDQTCTAGVCIDELEMGE